MLIVVTLTVICTVMSVQGHDSASIDKVGVLRESLVGETTIVKRGDSSLSDVVSSAMSDVKHHVKKKAKKVKKAAKAIQDIF